jgi:hypothetical protein
LFLNGCINSLIVLVVLIWRLNANLGEEATLLEEGVQAFSYQNVSCLIRVGVITQGIKAWIGFQVKHRKRGCEWDRVAFTELPEMPVCDLGIVSDSIVVKSELGSMFITQ